MRHHFLDTHVDLLQVHDNRDVVGQASADMVASMHVLDARPSEAGRGEPKQCQTRRGEAPASSRGRGTTRR